MLSVVISVGYIRLQEGLKRKEVVSSFRIF